MRSPSAFLTSTLRKHPYGQSIARIMAAAIEAVEPTQAVQRFVNLNGNTIVVDGKTYSLDQYDRVHILAVGKAAPAMMAPLIGIAGHSLVIPKHPFSPPWPGCEVSLGGHPVPNENSLIAGQKALELARSLGEKDLLICLISGGGSALMTAPHPELSLNDLQTLTRELLACGARVDEINTLRRHLDQVKGGGLVRAAFPAQVIGLILSDVVGNPLETIASGPTAPDPTSRATALQVLDKYDLTEKVPAQIRKVLEAVPENPKPGDALFERVQNVLVGSNKLAAQAGLAQAEAENFHTVFLGDTWQGEAREVAISLCKYFESDDQGPLCLIAGGETTVTLRSTQAGSNRKAGLGGRNQELALAAVKQLAGYEDRMLITLATDGEDGPTDAAGAVVSGDTSGLAQMLDLDPQTYLHEHDSYHFFESLDDLMKPGPTGTNVNDLTFLFRF